MDTIKDSRAGRAYTSLKDKIGSASRAVGGAANRIRPKVRSNAGGAASTTASTPPPTGAVSKASKKPGLLRRGAGAVSKGVRLTPAGLAVNALAPSSTVDQSTEDRLLEEYADADPLERMRLRDPDKYNGLVKQSDVPGLLEEREQQVSAAAADFDSPTPARLGADTVPALEAAKNQALAENAQAAQVAQPQQRGLRLSNPIAPTAPLAEDIAAAVAEEPDTSSQIDAAAYVPQRVETDNPFVALRALGGAVGANNAVVDAQRRLRDRRDKSAGAAQQQSNVDREYNRNVLNDQADRLKTQQGQEKAAFDAEVKLAELANEQEKTRISRDQLTLQEKGKPLTEAESLANQTAFLEGIRSGDPAYRTRGIQSMIEDPTSERARTTMSEFVRSFADQADSGFRGIINNTPGLGAGRIDPEAVNDVRRYEVRDGEIYFDTKTQRGDKGWVSVADVNDIEDPVFRSFAKELQVAQAQQRQTRLRDERN